MPVIDDATMRWGVRFFVAVLVILAVLPGSSARAESGFSLAVGQANFWPGGEHVESSSPPVEWPVRVAAGGARLRVFRTAVFAESRHHHAVHRVPACQGRSREAADR